FPTPRSSDLFGGFVPDRATTLHVDSDDTLATGPDEKFGERLFLVQQAGALPGIADGQNKVDAKTSARQRYADHRDDDLPKLLARGVERGAEIVPFGHHRLVGRFGER